MPQVHVSFRNKYQRGSQQKMLFRLLLFGVIATLASAEHYQLTKYIPAVFRTLQFPTIMCRGGSSAETSDFSEHDEESHTVVAEASTSPPRGDEPQRFKSKEEYDRIKSFQRPKKSWHTPDMIWSLLDEKHVVQDESYELRQVIMERAQEYLEDLAMATNERRIPDPLGVLHSVSPKIPAIKHSPNFMLRITSATPDIDAGTAACTIGVIARLCELYDKKISSEGQIKKSTGSLVIKDRRFEQLVECVLCGVDVKKRRQEALEMGRLTDDDSQDIEAILDGEESKVDEGLTVTDSCRAAWGLSILGGYNLESFGGENAQDIIIALSLRIRDLLLARLQKLRLGDVESDATQAMSMAERFDRDAEILAEDAAAAMWTFACVKACTGIRSVALFETCCSILCQNPTELRIRAQLKKTGFDDANFEVNDVVERLARSQSETEKSIPINTVISEAADWQGKLDERGTLIDWLSPSELTDAIWSLALHGSTNDIRLLHHKKLSETSATFREVAFDRLLECLEEDIHVLQQNRSSENAYLESDLYAGRDESVWEQDHDSMVIEVVDAAVIMAMERCSDSIVTSVENITMTDTPIRNGVNEKVEMLQVKGAAALFEGHPEIETEVGSSTSGRSSHQNAVPYTQLDSLAHPKSDIIFSPHNLCAIVWAATELNDSLRVRIVDLVLDIFMTRGNDRASGLVGGDLANLAWAIARRADIGSSEGGALNSTSCLTITDLIAREALSLEDNHSNDNERSTLLHHFQPPEIGRLTWSIALTTTILLDSSTRSSPEASRLAALCLRIAATNLPVFGSEDLARVAWAFLILYHKDDTRMDPTLAEPLGRILSILDASLLRWESGKSGATSSHDSSHAEDSIRYSSFLGRPRVLYPALLDQRVGEFDIDDDLLSVVPEKTSLPLLRDLSTDPATLCKLASGLAKFAANHPEIKGAWTVARIAVRLLVSRHGTLMKETSMKDIIRLCMACASNKIPGYGRETVTKLYARRVVQLLNEILGVSNDNVPDVLSLLKVSPWDLSNLIWSLGELGVHHENKDDNLLSAHRKLHLVTDKILLSDDQISTLSTTSLTKFLIGVISMDFLSSNPSFVVRVLTSFETRELASLEHSELCNLIEILAKARRLVQDSEKLVDIALTLCSEKEADSLPQISEDTVEEFVIASTSEVEIIKAEILALTQRILVSATDEAAGKVIEFSPEQLRRLMIVVTMLPFEAGVLVDAVTKEVISRTSDKSQQLKSLETMMSKADDTVTLIGKSLSGKEGNHSSFAELRNSLWSRFFRSEECIDPPLEQQSQQFEDMRNLLNEAATQTVDIVNRLRAITKISGSGIDKILQNIEEGANFELGRCKELIASYRRIDFQNGTRQTRYDKERRKDIGKRLLSRRFI